MLFGAAALAQTTGASSSGTSSNTDRYGSGTPGSSSSGNEPWNRDRSTPQTNASTSGAAAGSMNDRTSSDRSRTVDRERPTDRDRDAGRSDRNTRDTYATERSGDKLAWRERRFVTKAADHGTAELNLAQLATEKASNPEVRSYAQKLIEAHEKVKSELTALANQKNVKLDLDDDGKDRTYKRLSSKSGREFDEEFVEHMIEMHEDDVKMFEKAASDAKDAELRAFASKHVDHLREHLQQAQSLRQSIMPTGRDDDTPRSSRPEKSDTSTTPSTTDTTRSGSITTDTSRDSTTPTDRSTGSSATPESRR